MKQSEFIELLEEYFHNTGMSSWEPYLSVGNKENVNTTIYIDRDNFIWIRNDESVKRIKTSINVSKNQIRIKPLDLFKIKNKSLNKSLLYEENYKLNSIGNKSSKGLQAKIRNNFSTKKKINLNVVKMNFPYCKPFVKNSFTELVLYNKNRDFIIAKNLEKNKNKM